MTKPNRWMPLDWGDYWRDTGHLNAAEHGAYFNLLGAYWVSGQPLPDDDVRLRRLARCTAGEWRKARVAVRAFFSVRDGLLHHKRVEREISRAMDVYEARRARIDKINEKRRSSATSSSTSPSSSSPHSQTQTQIQIQDSVPIGTGLEAKPPGEMAGEGDVPSGSLKSRIFGPCLAWLAAQAKLSDAQARRVTARWCAKFGDGPVLEAFGAAARQSPLDPVPYIEKVLHHGALSSTGNTIGKSFASSPGLTRAAASARAQAVDHLAGLRAALGAGRVEGAPHAAAHAQHHNTAAVDGRLPSLPETGQR